MSNPWIVLLICALIFVAVMAGMYFWGRKLQKKQVEQKEQLNAHAQNMKMLIIDKKRMKLKEAGLPKIAVDETPWYLKGSKVPVVKAKVGPQIMTFICDEEIFDLVPVKKEVKAVVSGLYIMKVQGVRHVVVEKPKKKGFMAKLRAKANSMTNAEVEQKSKKK
jgi:ribosomal protein L23/uncharacterized protein YneF (UPF0154 family)